MDQLFNGNSEPHEEPPRERGVSEMSQLFQQEVRDQLQEVLRRLDGLAQQIGDRRDSDRQPVIAVPMTSARIYDPELDRPEARRIWREAPPLEEEEEETKIHQEAPALQKEGSFRRSSGSQLQAAPALQKEGSFLRSSNSQLQEAPAKEGSFRRLSNSLLRPSPSGVPKEPPAGSGPPIIDFSLPHTNDGTTEAQPPVEGAGISPTVLGKEEDEEGEEDGENQELDRHWTLNLAEGEKKAWIKSFYVSQNKDARSTLAGWAGWAGNVKNAVKKSTKTRTSMIEETQVGPTGLWQFVHSPLFDSLSCTIILLNVILIGVAADDQLRQALSRSPESSTWDNIDITFCVLFSVELALRITADRTTFLFGPEWRWNIFDAVLVVLSIADASLNAILTSINSANSATVSNLTTARVLRFVRLIRVTRVVRAVRAFHQLRIIVFAIFEAMSALIWCLLVVGLIIYVFAILFLYGVTEHFAGSSSVDPKLRAELLDYYGNVPRACTTLFMTISGGVDWKDAMDPLHDIHWTYMPLFTFFIFLMVIGVLNVVMGAFVAATTDMVAKDKEAMVKQEIHSLQVYTQKIKTFFKEADKDKSGTLSWSEFEEHLQVPIVAAFFHTLELDVSQAHALFKLLDKDGSNEVSLDEFLAGCMRLKGTAKSLEVQMLLYESRRLFAKVTDFIEGMTAKFPDVGLQQQDRSPTRRKTRAMTPKSAMQLTTPSPLPIVASSPSVGASLHEQIQEDAAEDAAGDAPSKEGKQPRLST